MAIDIWNSKPDIQKIILDTRFGKLNLDIARFDCIHPVISGNKYYKLHHNIEQFLNSDYSSLVTYGGVHSNHLHAFSYICKEYSIASVAYVSGWDGIAMTPTLHDVRTWGTELVPISRSEYRQHRAASPRSKRDTMVIPEGGNNDLGVLGASHMYDVIQAADYEVILTSVGSGTTFSGLYHRLKDGQEFHGFLSFNFDLEQFLENLITIKSSPNVSLHRTLYFGKFGSVNEELIQYVRQFEKRYSVPLDRVYNARSLHYLENSESIFETIKNKKAIYIHSGGLQGNRFSQIDD